jgi:hypothetical protein
VFLNPLLAEGGRRGQRLSAQTPALGWSLGTVPAVAAVPPGFRIERKGAAWMAALQAANVFTNGLGGATEAHRTSRNRFAHVLTDEDGETAAVAGAFTTTGMLEIGIDVARGYRGRGLAPVVVGAAVREILDSGGTPYYGCAATNIRSQRTALSCGFLPACSVAFVAPAGADDD